jgi:ribosomal protein L7/L12
VFTLTTTHEEAAPIYDHKWQNLAVLGLKIDAIKELRSITGMGLKPAKDAVEYFLNAA